MKRLLTIACVLFALAGCGPVQKDDENKESQLGIQILKKRGCEYVLYKDIGRSDISMVHAGDCTNPIHTSSPSEK